MADKLVFDSERLEKRRRIRRWLLPAAALLLLVVIAAALSLLFRGGRGKVITGGEDTDYPYTWRSGKNGVVTLALDRAAAPGYLWISSEKNMQMTVVETQEESRTSFTLTPLREGRAYLEFYLVREGDEEERIFELSLLTEITNSGRTLRSELLSASGRQFQGQVRGGEETDYPYLVRMDEDGDLVVIIKDNTPEPEESEETEEEAADRQDSDPDIKAEGWSCVSEDESIAEVLGVITADDGVAVYLRSGTAPGTVRVRIEDPISGTELLLELESYGRGTLLLRDHSLHTGEGG